MDEKQEKNVNEIANEVTERIASSCPDEMGMVISIVLKNLHNMFEERIAGSETNLVTDKDNYVLFLKHIEIPEAKPS